MITLGLALRRPTVPPRPLALWSIAISLSCAGAGVMDGLLAPRVGVCTLLYAHGGVVALAVVVVGALMSPRWPQRSAPYGVVGMQYRRAVRDPRLWLVALATLAAMVCASTLVGMAPIALCKDGLSVGAVGWMQVSAGTVAVSCSPWVMRFMGHRAARGSHLVGALALGSLALGIGMGGIGRMHTDFGHLGAVVISGVGAVLLLAAAPYIVTHLAPAGAEGAYAGLWGGITVGFAPAIPPLLAAWATRPSGQIQVGFVLLVCGLLGAALCMPLAALIHSPPPQPPAPSAVPLID